MTESGCKLCLKKGWRCKVLLTATSEELLVMPRCCVLWDELVLRPLSLAEVRYVCLLTWCRSGNSSGMVVSHGCRGLGWTATPSPGMRKRWQCQRAPIVNSNRMPFDQSFARCTPQPLLARARARASRACLGSARARAAQSSRAVPFANGFFHLSRISISR